MHKYTMRSFLIAVVIVLLLVFVAVYIKNHAALTQNVNTAKTIYNGLQKLYGTPSYDALSIGSLPHNTIVLLNEASMVPSTDYTKTLSELYAGQKAVFGKNMQISDVALHLYDLYWGAIIPVGTELYNESYGNPKLWSKNLAWLQDKLIY